MKMKMLGFCLAAAVGVALPSFGDTYTSEGYLQDGLVAQWDGINNAGVGLHLPDSGVWKDLVGNCDLTLLAGKGWVPGRPALKVSKGTAQGAAAAPAYRTIEVFYKMTSASGRILFNSGRNKQFVFFDSSGTKGYFDGSNRDTKYVAWTFDATALRSMAATYTESNVVNAVYRDGTAVENGTHKGSWNTGDGKIMIGDRAVAGSSYSWSGEVYALRLYSTELTAEQIAANHAIDVARFTDVADRLLSGVSALPEANLQVKYTAGQAGDSHVLRLLWDTTGVDYGVDVASWPNNDKIADIADDGTSSTFAAPEAARVANRICCRAILTKRDGTVVAVSSAFKTDPLDSSNVFPRYIVTVEEGTTNYLDQAMVDVVAEYGGATQQVSFVSLTETEGALTNGTFVKQGRGFLVSSTNMVTWLGEILINEGAILLDWSGELGPKNSTANAVRIANGASIGLIADKMKSQAMNIYNTIYLSGRGIDDLGVIFNAANCGGNYMRKAFRGQLEFEGDALFRGWMNDFGCDGEHRLNGHTLTISMTSGNYLTNDGKFRNGNLVIEKGSLYPQSGLTFYGGDTNTLTFKSGTKFGGYHANNLTTPWTLVLEDGTTVGFSADTDGTAPKNYWESTSYDDWEGPVNLLGKTTVTTASSGAQYAVPFPIRGMLYGPGWFNVTKGWLRLSNSTNCFTGPISVRQGDYRYWAGVGFHNATAWPQDNWTVLTNVNGAIQLSADNVRLPDLDVTASGGNFTNSFIFGTGSGTARSLVKRGSGLLALDALTAVTGVTELVEGTLRLPKVETEMLKETLYSDVPGLVEHRAFYVKNPSADEWKSFQEDGIFPQTTTMTNETTKIKSTPVLANTTGGSNWPYYHFVSYDGYIWNRSPTNETWSFALGVAHRGAIAIDGRVVCGSVPKSSYASTSPAVWPYLRTNTVDVAPGPHAFCARVGNCSYAKAGARQVYNTYNDEAGAAYVSGASSTNPVFPWPTNFGCVFNRDGVMSTNSACYTKPLNGTLSATTVVSSDALVGGDGYLFTRSTNNVEDCDFTNVRVWNDEILHLKGHAGSVFDINNPGLTVNVKTLEGVTTVTNGHLRVLERWTVDAGDVASGDMLKCYDRLLLGADAMVAVQETGHVRNSPEGGWAMIEADGGITLEEGWQSRVTLPNGKYRLSLSGDGKRLVLEHFNGTLFTIR